MAELPDCVPFPLDQLWGEAPERWIEALGIFERGGALAQANAMLAVFEVAAELAEDDGSLAWAEVAVRAANLDSRQAKNESEAEMSMSRAMRLRSRFVSRLGSRPGHPVLDVDVIVTWIKSGFTLSLEEATTMVHAMDEFRARVARMPAEDERGPVPLYDGMPVEDLLRLRRIKHRLEVALTLSEAGELYGDAEIASWLPLRKSLP